MEKRRPFYGLHERILLEPFSFHSPLSVQMLLKESERDGEEESQTGAKEKVCFHSSHLHCAQRLHCKYWIKKRSNCFKMSWRALLRLFVFLFVTIKAGLKWAEVDWRRLNGRRRAERERGRQRYNWVRPSGKSGDRNRTWEICGWESVVDATECEGQVQRAREDRIVEQGLCVCVCVCVQQMECHSLLLYFFGPI